MALKTLTNRSPFLSFVAITFAITLFGHTVHQLGVLPSSRVFDLLAAVAPSVAGVLVILSLHGMAGIRKLLARLAPQRSDLLWVLACLLLPLVAAFSRVAVLAFAGATVPAPNWLAWPDWFLDFAYVFMVAGVGEELGWRGFAQVHLQKTMSPLRSSTVIGLVWAMWHFPKWFIVFGYSVSWALILFLAIYTATVVALAVVFGVVHNATRAALFPVLILHASFDAQKFVTDRLFSPNEWSTLLVNHLFTPCFWWLAAAALIIFNRSIFPAPHLQANDCVNRSGESGGN